MLGETGGVKPIGDGQDHGPPVPPLPVLVDLGLLDELPDGGDGRVAVWVGLGQAGAEGAELDAGDLLDLSGDGVEGRGGGGQGGR